MKKNKNHFIFKTCFLLITIFFGFVVLEGTAKAVDILPGNTANGYVSNLSFYQGSSYYEETVVDCPFIQELTDYDLYIKSVDTSYNKAILRIEVEDTSGDLWYRLYVDGTAYSANAREKKITRSPLNVTADYWFTTQWPNDGEDHTITVQIGKKYDSNGDGSVNYKDDFETSDVYNYHVKEIPGLKTFTVKDSMDNTQTLSPQYIPGGNSRRFVTVTTGEILKVSATFTDNTTLFIGDNTFTTALTDEAIDLTVFYNAETGYNEVPLRLVNNRDRETIYTIVVSPVDYTPVVTKHPESVTCNKGDNIVLNVELEVPEGSSLTYQWLNMGNPIAGATESTYYPDTSRAGTTKYACVVTNTVGNEKYMVTSNYADVTINLSSVNSPEFVDQPGSIVYPSGVYNKNYDANTTFDELFFSIVQPEPGVDCNFDFYVNTQPTYDGAQIIEGTVAAKLMSSKEIYGFTTKRTFDIGTYYVGCVCTFTATADSSMTVKTESEFVELVFTPVQAALSGTGSQTDPFLIATAEDMTVFRDMIGAGNTYGGAFFKVTDDINLPTDWTSIGTETAFAGDFDGADHTVSYARGSSPLFEKVGPATIHNLNLYGEQINGCGLINGVYSGDDVLNLKNITLKAGSSTLQSGFALGSARAASRIAFEGCVVESGVTVGYGKDQNGIGSFVGSLVGTLTDCRSGADVYGGTRVGGLAGSNANSMGQCYFTDCAFTGSVTATGNNAGGIIGRGYEDTTAPNTRLIRVDGCTMSGTVTGAANVGGLIGSEGGLQQSYDAASAGSVTGNTVTGTVSGSSNVGALAGLYSHLDRYTVFENNSISGPLSAFGKVYHVDTSAVAYGWHDGVFYFNSSATYTAEQLEEIYTALWTGWEDSGRWKPTSLITGRERADNPLNCDAVMETIEIASMPTKTEYMVGEEFDPAGLVVTLTDLNGATRELTSDEYTISGFDSSRPGVVSVAVTFGEAVATFEVTIVPPTGETINVKLSILGDTLHEGEEVVHTLAAGNLTTWVAETTYTVDSNATVWNLLLIAFEENSITYTYRMSLGTEYIDSVTFNGVTLTEKDNNPNSGWQYTINGQDSTNGVNQQYLAEGDVICFHWTDDYTQEDYGGQYEEDKQAAMAVEALIDALPAADEITLADEEAIVAARAAYDALSDGAKAYVDPDCLAILVAAEARLTELKAEQAAADQAAADAVTAKIAAIGEVTLDSETAITEARAAYDALTDAQKALVTNLDTLTAAEARLEELKAQQADQQAADAVTAKIAAIGEVTLDSEAAITEARAAYDALTDAQKALVTNLETLTAAETRLAELKAEQAAADQAAADAVSAKIAAIGEVTLDSETAITEARAAYDALTDAQKALVTNLDVLTAAETRLAELKQQQADQAAADAVIAQIAAIGEVTIEDEKAIAAARAAYEALTPEQKALVGNIDTLTAAETALEALVEERDQQAAGAVSAMIAALPAVDELTVSDEEAITAARAAYDALTDAQKAKVTNLDVLKAAEDKLAELKFGTLKTTVKAVNVKDGTIKLTWTTIPGAVKYKVLVSTTKTGTYKPVATVTGKTYSYKKGTVGKAAYFKVVGVNKEGTESAESAVATRFRLPGQVKGLKATSKEKKVTLKWTKVTGAKKYFVYMSKNGKTGWKKVGTVTTNKFVYEKGKAGKKLYFKVQAVTANGKKGEFSKVIGIKVKE